MLAWKVVGVAKMVEYIGIGGGQGGHGPPLFSTCPYVQMPTEITFILFAFSFMVKKI